MKHNTHKNEELIDLSNYFKSIEELAEKLGVDIDDLVNEYSPGFKSGNLSSKKELLLKGRKRIQTLFEQAAAKQTNDQSIVRGPFLED